MHIVSRLFHISQQQHKNIVLFGGGKFQKGAFMYFIQKRHLYWKEKILFLGKYLKRERKKIKSNKISMTSP